MDTIKETIGIIIKYNGTGLFLLLFLAAFIYLAVSEKAGAKRLLLFWLPASVLAFILCPLTAWLSFHYIMDVEIFYRQLWLVPYGAIVAYAVVRLISGLKKNRQKVPALLVCVALIMLGGSNVLLNGSLKAAENPYHLPQEALEVCDIITAVPKPHEIQYPPRTGLPMALVEYNRQYTCEFVTAYGRESIVARWNLAHPFITLITNTETITAEEIFNAANSDMIECFVLEKKRPVEGNIEDYGYVNIGETENYSVYMMKWLAE